MSSVSCGSKPLKRIGYLPNICLPFVFNSLAAYFSSLMNTDITETIVNLLENYPIDYIVVASEEKTWIICCAVHLEYLEVMCQIF